MNTKNLKVKTKSTKRIGRGYGSGKGGHTSSRGMKGQKSRSSLGILFEGVKIRKSLLRRLPLKRGKDVFKAHPKPIIINMDHLNMLSAGAKVNIESLVKAGIVKESDAKQVGIKILGNGKLTKKLTVELPTSKSAKKQIEKLGGKVN